MRRVTPFAFCSLVFASAVCSQALVKDINPVLVNGNGIATTATPQLVIGGTAYFPGNDGVNGVELWSTNGTTAGTTMLKDINLAAAASSTPAGLTAFGAGFVFSATDGVAGVELWKSDGTAAGTVMVSDIFVGASSSSPSGFAVIGATVYFAAADAAGGRELWSYDGTTVAQVKDIQVGATGSISGTGNMVAVGATLYFAAVDIATTGTELWKSDGTAAGTVLVKDINPTASASSSPALLLPFGALVYFNANDGVAGIEPWISDGTLAGTVLLKDVMPGLTTSSPTQPVVAGGKLFFQAQDTTAVTGTGRELYVSDGTPAGTKLVVDLNPGLLNGCVNNPVSMVAVGALCAFAGNNGATGNEVWLSDGTAGGTTLYADYWPGINSSDPGPIVPFGGKIYTNATDGSFSTGNFELMVSDGTPAGTKWIKDIWPGASTSDPQGFFTLGGVLYFNANQGNATGIELWTTDGTTAGTVLVKDINTVGGTPASSSPALLTKMGNNVYFQANDGANLIELWKTDGTTAGTSIVKDINPIGSSSPANLTVVGTTLFFSANDGTNGVELWKSDGTAAGTVLVKDINTSAAGASSSPTNFRVLGNKLFFNANDGLTGVEPWISDGTALGTVQLKDCYPGISSGMSTSAVVSGGKVFFIATDSTATVGTGTELYVTDGTPAGTTLLEVNPGIASGSSTTTTAMAAFGSGVVFLGITAATGSELWKSDGTLAGTSMIIDLNPGAGSSTPFPTVVANGKIYTQASNGASGFELVISDGTAGGTLLVDIFPGATSSSATAFTQLGSKVVFTANDGVGGTNTEPWVTDGTLAGTMLLMNINTAAAGSSSPANYVVNGGVAFFGATSGATVTGNELYVTDGTPGGTALAKDINAGTGSGVSAASFRIGAGKRVVLNATDGTVTPFTGNELWVSDGTPAGTTRMFDLNPLTASSSPTNFTVLGDNLLFTATNGTSTLLNPAAVGTELWSISLTALGASEVEVFGSSCQGTGTPTIGTSGGAPFAGNAAFNVDVSNAAPSAPAALYLNNTRGDVPIGPCTIYPSLVPVIAVSTTTNASGAASINLSIPPGAWNIGIQLYFQYVIVDVGGPILGLASSTAGLRIRIGAS